MTDYFFHVAIEVATEPTSTEPDLEPPNLSHFFAALRPFTNRTRAQRNPKYDTRALPQPRKHDITGAEREKDHKSNNVVVSSQLNDQRFDTVYLDGIDMDTISKSAAGADGREDPVNKGIGSALTDSYLKGYFAPADHQDAAAASWGIVHLYRDADPTPSLSLNGSAPYQFSDLWSDTPRSQPGKTSHSPPADSDCTTLCILAVPSYMTPADFLAFVGEKTCDTVSHFRMVRTQRQNRYMVLMKFRDGKTARKWQAAWNGKVWNAMEPETCHVVFLKSVELLTTTHANKPDESTFPQLSADPFSATAKARPLAPPTPSLVELPTCPVCLERMDETTGLLTIPCQHVFHCTCLQKWSGGGCPVCRYTHDDFSSRGIGTGKKSKKTKKINADGTVYEYEPADDDVLECETCHEDAGSLWQCLICGSIGCGRYEGKHAHQHHEKTGHLFAMDLSSKRVWDYKGDGYVHRIMVEDNTITAAKDGVQVGVREVGADDLDTNYTKGDPSPAIENLALEYTHLLTSQLESQRVYFEEIVERLADKASEANKRAEHAEAEGSSATTRLTQIEADNDLVTKGKLPELEKENTRLTAKARKLEDMAKDVNHKYLEEKSTVHGLLARISHLEGTEIAALKQRIQQLQEESATNQLLMEGLRDEHRDAMIQVSAERQLREMVERGEIEKGELEGAEVTIGKKPLTPSQRLKERLDAEREVRSKGKGKEKVMQQKASVDGGEACPSASGLADQLLALANSTKKEFNVPETVNMEKSEKWDEAAANTLLQEMTTKMLEMGLLQKKIAEPVANASVSQVEAEKEAKQEPEQSSSQKRRSKGRGKGKR